MRPDAAAESSNSDHSTSSRSCFSKSPASFAALSASCALLTASPDSCRASSASPLAASAVVFAPFAVLSASCATASKDLIFWSESASLRWPYSYAPSSAATANAKQKSPILSNVFAIGLWLSSIRWATTSQTTSAANSQIAQVLGNYAHSALNRVNPSPEVVTLNSLESR